MRDRVGDRVGVTNHALEEGQELEQLRVARVVEPALDRDAARFGLELGLGLGLGFGLALDPDAG